MALNLTGGLLSGLGVADQLRRNSQIGDRAIEGTDNLSQQAVSGTQFRPFGVTTSSGAVDAQPDGSLTLTHSPQTNSLVNQLNDGTAQFFGQATQGTAGREADVYDRIRATQLPEEQRAQMALQDRLYAQGRGGISSDAYGGTPEQLALHKAIQESQNQASLMALQQGQAEQLQQANLGGLFQNASFMPQAQLLNAFNPALNVANMGQTGQIAGQNLASQLGLGGLQTQLNSEAANSNLIGGLFSGLSGAATQAGFDPVGDGLGWVWDHLQGLFS